MTLLNTANKVLVGSNAAASVYLGTNKVWTSDPLAGVAVGDPFMGGYYVGIIDTTKGNIIAADTRQTGQRYALIVSPKSMEHSAKQQRTTDTSFPASRTRWDGLYSTAQMLAAGNHPAASHCAAQSRPADAASDWYLPAYDELNLLYARLKPTTTATYLGWTRSPEFPTPWVYGQNLSSDPQRGQYVSGDVPVQTTVAAFKNTGSQPLASSGATAQMFWSSTEYSTAAGWVKSMTWQNPGLQNSNSKTGTAWVRPVRRLVL